MTATPHTFEIPTPDDWHLHLRNGSMLRAVAPISAALFRHALVMPNLQPPVVTVAAADTYRSDILKAVEASTSFAPLMALYLHDSTTPAEVELVARDPHTLGFKFYPKGATTNSAEGADSMMSHASVLEMMSEQGVRLFVHAESTDPQIDLFDREAAFLETELAGVCERFPDLKVTVEHVSTAAGVEFVKGHKNVWGSITPHHMTVDRSDLLASGVRPDLYCKPVINSAADREAVAEVALSGDPSFFFGSDSAPHATAKKYGPVGAAGIFNAAHALAVVCELFHQNNAEDQLAAFLSSNGCAAYNVDPPLRRVRATRLSEPAAEARQELVTDEGETVVFFGVEAARRWSFEQIHG